MVDRRTFVKSAATATLAAGIPGCRQDSEDRKWSAAALSRQERSTVAVLKAAEYDHHLTEIVASGIRLSSLDPSGLRIVLKPNLVEYDPEGVINTHPTLIAATIEAFRALGAADVVVAEGPGHRRDDAYLLTSSGLAYALKNTGAAYADLNTDDVRAVPLRSRYTKLGKLYLPATVLGTDLLVSMPKLKTHHWAGVTLSLKNMFGIMPGLVYGWPKNVLHWEGIASSILDINAALTVPRFNIVDGIIGMEGNGPIQGDAKHVGALVFGTDPVAVDATCARLMGIDPERVDYLREAGRFLGNVSRQRIHQTGEPPHELAQDFEFLEDFASLKPSLVG
jgi:uncharacterized protein (DUF362 family)